MLEPCVTLSRATPFTASPGSELGSDLPEVTQPLRGRAGVPTASVQPGLSPWMAFLPHRSPFGIILINGRVPVWSPEDYVSRALLEHWVPAQGPE